jgi:hypothetical protein
MCVEPRQFDAKQIQNAIADLQRIAGALESDGF